MGLVLQANAMHVISVRAFALVSTLFLIVAGFQYAAAQETVGIQMRPAIIEERVDPGETRTFSITATNIADEERTFYLSAYDITGIDVGGVPQFANEGEKTPYELSSWITLPANLIVLQPNESRSISFSVRVPTDASPGSHFGGVFFEAKPEQSLETGAAVGARVGTVVSLRISGDIIEEVLLREFSTEQFIYNSPPVDFTMRIENRGNVIARPHGGIEVTDMFGKKVATVEVNSSGAAVFPGGERDFTASWQQDGFVFGRYSAMLSIVSGEEGRKTVVRSTSFWILPLKPTLITLGILLGIIVFVYAFMRVYIRRTLRQMGVTANTAAPMRGRTLGVSRLAFVAVGVAVLGIVLLLGIFTLFA